MLDFVTLCSDRCLTVLLGIFIQLAGLCHDLQYPVLAVECQLFLILNVGIHCMSV